MLVVSENLLIVVVEAGQQLKGPRGRRLHRVRHVLIGRYAAAAGVDDVAADTTIAAVASASTTTTGSGDTACGSTDAAAAAASVGDAGGTADGDVIVGPDLLPPDRRRCFLPL